MSKQENSVPSAASSDMAPYIEVEAPRPEDVLKPLLRQRIRTAIGGAAAGVAGIALSLALSSGLDDEKIAPQLPFQEEAQEIVNEYDDALAAIGVGVLALGSLAIGTLKVAALKSSYIRSIDSLSSKPLASEDTSRSRFTSNKVAGGIVAGVAAGTIAAGIGVEITEGPTRPIVAFTEELGAETLVVQHGGAMPMLDSNVGRSESEAILAEAKQRNIHAMPLGLELTSISYKDKALTSIVFGVDTAVTPALRPSADITHTGIPVLIDEVSGIPVGSQIEINGKLATIVGTTEDNSAINRVTIIMDKDLMAKELEGDPEHSYHALLMDADKAEVQDILDTTDNTELTALTTDEYIKNSEKFWEQNSKPLTSVLALLAGAVTFVSTGSMIKSGILQNRRELATALASGDSVKTLKIVEMLRALKQGMVSSGVGIAAATALVPAVNMISSGLRVGIGAKEILVGAALGIGSSVAGSFVKLLKLAKTINPEEHTRI